MHSATFTPHIRLRDFANISHKLRVYKLWLHNFSGLFITYFSRLFRPTVFRVWWIFSNSKVISFVSHVYMYHDSCILKIVFCDYSLAYWYLYFKQKWHILPNNFHTNFFELEVDCFTMLVKINLSSRKLSVIWTFDGVRLFSHNFPRHGRSQAEPKPAGNCKFFS